MGDAILDTTVALVAEHGLRAVTMSLTAEQIGIGRAALYKYFPDVEAILVAWHEGHVAQLQQIHDDAADPLERLHAVLTGYATIVFERARRDRGTDVSALVHQEQHVAGARQHLTRFLQRLITEAVRGGELRSDVAPDELATYCVHALGGSAGLRSRAAVERLVEVTPAGLRTRAG